MSVEANEQLVPTVVAKGINGGDLDAIDRLYAPEIAGAARAW